MKQDVLKGPLLNFACTRECTERYIVLFADDPSWDAQSGMGYQFHYVQ